MTLATGQILQNRYHITSHIGQGGMGTVYQAQDARLGHRLVAIKEFDPAQLPAADRSIAQQAFQQEAAILARLSHVGLTAVQDYFYENNRFYLVMEFVQGETLQRAWERAGRRFAEAQVVSWSQELCDVLNYLHSQNPPVIFRDLKPGNIMVQPNGRLKLIDFGIARHFTPGKTSDTVKFGTPGYAAPEQYGQGQTDARSDVYALGVVTHQLLTGHDPAQTPFHLPPINRLAPQISPALSQAVTQAVEMDPAKRPSSAAHYHQMLSAQTQPVAAKRPLWVWFGGAALLILMLAALVWRFVLPGAIEEPANRIAPLPEQEMVAQTGDEAEPPPTETPTETPTATLTATPEPPPTAVSATPTPPPLAAPMVVAVNPPGALAQRPQDNQTLVYVPAGTLPMGAADGAPNELPVHDVTLDAFWIDQTEVTNAQFAAFLNANGNRVEGSAGNTWINLNDDFALITGSGGNYTPKAGAANRPAVMVTWYGANAYCRWAGGALPTEAQWEYAARGPQALIYPWGNDVGDAPLNFCDANCQYSSIRNASFDDGFATVAPVGSFPNGRSWVGAFDMAGNAWEWTADWFGAYGATAVTNPTGPATGDKKVLRGGSWGDPLNSTRTTFREPYPPDARNGLIGFRCVMAETAVAPPPSNSPANVAEPIVTSGNDSARVASSDAMPQIFIPAGEFSMGDSAGNNDEKPVHTVYLDDYWLDQTEVTNAQFAQFVAATGHQTTAEREGRGWIYDGGWREVSGANWRFPQGQDSGIHGRENHPVVQVSWYDAEAYCAWAGRRLPTEAEWEKAARGADQRAYPWGNEFDGARLNFCDASCTPDVSVNDGYAGTAPVGSYPAGASPYGVLDMAGNAFEWVADWYGANYYANSPARNPVGPADGQYKVLRGGSWGLDRSHTLTTAREVSTPSGYNDNIGFRCAQNGG